jgi:hypothetical protein
VAPDFVKENTASQILNFYSDCNRRYAETGDAKTFLQEMATMTSGQANAHAFVTLCIDQCDTMSIKDALQWDSGGNSFVYSLNGQQYALIHNRYADQILSDLDYQGTPYVRPDWDQRYNVYAISPENESQMMRAIESFNNAITSGNSPRMSAIMMDNGSIGVEVDTSINKQFFDMCYERGIAIQTLETNIDIHELHAKELEFGWSRTNSGLENHEFEWSR